MTRATSMSGYSGRVFNPKIPGCCSNRKTPTVSVSTNPFAPPHMPSPQSTISFLVQSLEAISKPLSSLFRTRHLDDTSTGASHEYRLAIMREDIHDSPSCAACFDQPQLLQSALQAGSHGGHMGIGHFPPSLQEPAVELAHGTAQ